MIKFKIVATKNEIIAIWKLARNIHEEHFVPITAPNKLNICLIDSVVQDIGNGFVMDDYVMEKKTII